MKNTASTFIQYLENKKTPGHQKVVGFTIESGVTKIQFKTFPSISEWLAICEVWSDVFEQKVINLHIEKLNELKNIRTKENFKLRDEIAKLKNERF